MAGPRAIDRALISGSRAKALIFDLDGTLADTLGDIGAAMSHVLTELGLPAYDLDRYRPWVGWGVRHLVTQALPDGAEHLADTATAQFRRYYGDNLIVTTAPYPGIPELLDALTGHYALAVLSNKPQAMTERIVTEVFGRWAFAEVVGARDGVPHKPDPTSALELAARLEVSPAHCVFVGDTGVDMQTARAANMRAIAAGWGFRAASELRDAGAEVVLGHPAELLDVLDVLAVLDSAAGLRVAPEPLDSPTAYQLIGALNAELSAQYPEPGATHFRLDPDEVAPGRGLFVVARLGEVAVGCGAMRKIAGDTAELKRMYTHPLARGHGIGRALLDALEASAPRLGVSRIVLETGVRQAPALALYERAGYTRIEPYGEYTASPLSICYGKTLA